MSIVPCPQCGKKISSLAPICDHCGHSVGQAGKEEQQRYRERKLRDRIYRLNMATYGLMGAVILAFAWQWAATGGFQLPADTHGPYYLMIASAVIYLVVRISLYRARAQRKANWQGD